MKRVLFTILVMVALAGGLLITNKNILAAETNNTSSKAIESIFQNAKEALDNLIVTKDSGNLNDTASRIKAFIQVLDLSIAEAKEYAAKLVAVPKNDDYNLWIEESLKTLADKINYFNEQKKKINNSSPSLEQIKNIALDFKKWREEEYMPFVKSLQTFLLIEQENNALDVAQKRLDNIKNDISKISFKSKDKKTIENYINSSSYNIEEAKLLNERAYKAFLSLYVTKKDVNESQNDLEKTKVSTNKETALAENEINQENNTNESEIVSEEKNIQETEEKISDESIRVLVRDSLNKIKEAYQNFIDLSNYVRRLLK